MKFTLSLRDYMEQYLTNMDNDCMYCPVCYDECMCGDQRKDMEHMIECYKDDMIVRVLTEYHDKHGELPPIDEQFMNQLEQQVLQEMAQFYDDIS